MNKVDKSVLIIFFFFLIIYIIHIGKVLPCLLTWKVEIYRTLNVSDTWYFVDTLIFVRRVRFFLYENNLSILSVNRFKHFRISFRVHFKFISRRDWFGTKNCNNKQDYGINEWKIFLENPIWFSVDLHGLETNDTVMTLTDDGAGDGGPGVGDGIDNDACISRISRVIGSLRCRRK